jgi:hypothetical protein
MENVLVQHADLARQMIAEPEQLYDIYLVSTIKQSRNQD